MPNESKTDQKFWTLKEAVYRFCDRTTVKKLKAALADPDIETGRIIKKKGRRVQNFVTGKVNPVQHRPETNRDLIKPLGNKLWDEFKQLLLAGEIVSKAKKSYPTAEFENLDASAWKYLKVSNTDETMAYVSAKPNNIKYYDLQFLLPQDAPLPDQSDPTNATGVANVNTSVKAAVKSALKKFAGEQGYNEDELKLHFAKHGSKSEWYRDWFVNNYGKRWKEDSVTRQIASYII